MRKEDSQILPTVGHQLLQSHWFSLKVCDWGGKRKDINISISRSLHFPSRATTKDEVDLSHKECDMFIFIGGTRVNYLKLKIT